ncbi:uncharacterized protein LOC121853395 [Homarus americanus]|uniref:uncharacterized protein LOC121853395 n=1 Tax=Homarus americanus TaxID=6706 RepID=UPI001C43DCBE|nr:uncharacterized protein LOC121853395 [Homarus americanus]
MALPVVNVAPEVPIMPSVPLVGDPRDQHILNRKRRMNFFDMANLLDSDGNLQNEMLVFAFAATMLSTIPVLLGNEFDVNVGLRKRRQAEPYQDPDDPDNNPYDSYTSSPNESHTEPFFSGYTYMKIMTSPPGTSYFHIHNSSTTAPDVTTGDVTHSGQESVVVDASMADLLRELLQWSQEKVKDKLLLPMLINLALDKYSGNPNPADKLVRATYKKWKNYWY